jgi:hypothetical protein
MSNTPLNQSNGMPQMGAAFRGWMSSITLTRVTQSIEDGLVETREQKISFQGTVQPLSPQKTALKPEGQRAWKWLQIHCFTGGTNLATNDKIIYNGELFKVMDILDYKLNNYIEYHITADYQNG